MISDEQDLILPEHKFTARCLEALQFNVDFLLRNVQFKFYDYKLYERSLALQKSLQELRTEYANNIKFNYKL